MKRFIAFLCTCSLLMNIAVFQAAASDGYEVVITNAEVFEDVIQVTYNTNYLSTSCNMIVAAYSGNCMTAISMQTIPQEKYTSGETVHFTLTGSEDADYFNVFCFNSDNNEPFAESKTIQQNAKFDSLKSYLTQRSSENLQYYDHTLADGVLTITYNQSFSNDWFTDSISVFTGLEDVITRADIACYGVDNEVLTEVSVTNSVREIEERVPYARFCITNKENASDKFEVIVKQVDDTTLIYGNPPKAMCDAEYSYQLSGGDLSGGNIFEFTELPKGLNLYWNGLIYGTPTESGVCEFTASIGASSRRLRIIIMPNISFTQPLTAENTHDGFSFSVPESEVKDGRSLSVQSLIPTDDSVLQCASVDVTDGSGAVTQIEGIVMTMHFDPSVVGDKELKAAYFDETTESWKTQNADIDYNNGIATIHSDHLSIWGLIFGSDASIYRGMGSYGSVKVKYNSDNDCNIGSKVYTQKQMAEIVATTFATTIYPQFRSLFRTSVLSDSQSITISIMRNDPDSPDGYSNGSSIYLNGSNYESWGEVYNTLYHEYFHIIQAKYIGTWRMSRSSELWFTEGAADIFAAAYTAATFPNEKGSFVNRTGKKIPPSWFDDITNHNGSIEYASSYFAGFVASEHNINQKEPVYKMKGGKITLVPPEPGESPGASIAWGLKIIYDSMKNESKGITEILAASSLLRFVKFYISDYPLSYPQSQGYVCPFEINDISRWLLVNNTDYDGNYIPDTRSNISQRRPGVKVFNLSCLAEDTTSPLYVTVSASDSLKSFSYFVLNAYERTDNVYRYNISNSSLSISERFFRPLSVSTELLNNYIIVARMDGAGYFSGGADSYNITLGNMGGMTGNNIELQFTETPLEFEEGVSVSFTASYIPTTDTANLDASYAFTPNIDIGKGTTGTVLSGNKAFEIYADGIRVGRVFKNYSYTIVGQ